MKKRTIVSSLLALSILAALPQRTPAAVQKAQEALQDQTVGQETIQELPDTQETIEPQVIIPAASTSKQSSTAIRITWDAAKDASVKYYYVMRRSTKNSIGKGAWTTIAEIEVATASQDASYTYTDKLKSSAPQQYEYKICTLFDLEGEAIDTRTDAYADATNEAAVFGTNIKVCIDAGHFGTLNNNFTFTGADGNFPYSEAEFNLETAKALQTELKDAYGIDSYLTRTKSSVSLSYGGKTYKNENLDQKNIAVRGYMAKAKDCDLFVSLHTNSTSRQTKTWSQPKSINKAYVFVNQPAHTSDIGMKIANTIGTSLTEYNQEAGIQTAGFTKRSKNRAASFSTIQNDAAKTNGTVIHRRSSSGSDYYGVLRGAAVDNVPGILIEHAFHVTQIVRKRAALSTDLSENWAACDAYGIAYGYGFLK